MIGVQSTPLTDPRSGRDALSRYRLREGVL